jgi:hypothetical protein
MEPHNGTFCYLVGVAYLDKNCGVTQCGLWSL